MLKKVIVISFNLLFLVATTGLPLSVHLCKMMDGDKMNSCEMMHNNIQHNGMPACQEKEDVFQPQVVKTDCCDYIPLETIIADKFLSFKTEISHNVSLIALITSSGTENAESQNRSTNILEDHSPPSKLNNHIYLDNSILLI